MKHFTLLAIAVFTLGLSACAGERDPNTVLLKIDGMTCEPCAATLEKKFSKEKTVERVDVNWKKGIGKIIEKPGVDIQDHEIEKIVDWSGFELISVERK